MEMETRVRTEELALRKLGIEEIEERLEASPVLPGDPAADACCGCTCEVKPIVELRYM